MNNYCPERSDEQTLLVSMLFSGAQLLRLTFINRNDVRNTVSGIHDDPCRSAGRVQ